MKYVFTYLLLLVGLVSASASPIYAWESVNRSQMQSQRIMRSGVAYSGTVYTPFDNTSPSEYHPVAAGQDQDASGGRHGHIRKGKITGPDTPPANQYPIGEPWILALFAAIMAAVIAIKHQIKQKQQTAKNIMTMQNNNIKSERMFKVCKRSVLRMFYVISILFTIGIGQMWGYVNGSAYLYFNPDGKWSYDKYYFTAIKEHDSWETKVYLMSNIAHTNLYYLSTTEWNDADYITIGAQNGDFSGGYWGYDSYKGYISMCGEKCNWGLDYTKTYTFKPSANTKGTSINPTYHSGGYSDLNHSQTVYKYTSSGGTSAGSYTAQSVASGTVTISAYKMTGNGTASNTSNSATISAASTTSASKKAAYTGEVTLTASPNANYIFEGWYESTSATTPLETSTTYTYNAPNSTHSVYARFRYEQTYTITIANNVDASTTTAYVGATTPIEITAPDINDHTFNTWSAMPANVTKYSGNLTDKSIYIRATAAATVTANYNLIPCKVRKYSSGRNGTLQSTSSAMSYDASVDAYYIQITTDAKPYYYRIYYNNSTEYYSGWKAGGTTTGEEVTANGSKVSCDQKDYTDKPAMYFDGLSGSTIKIWFDFQNKKTWITEATYSVTVNNGDHGTVSPNGSQSVGKNSGKSIEATPSTGYLFDYWSKTGNAVLSSTSTNPTIVTATNTGTVTAHYKSRWAWISNKNSWNDATNRLGNYTTAGGKTTGYVELDDLAANTQYSFKFKDIDGSGTWYGPTTNTDITYSNKATAQTMSRTDGGDPNQTITTAGAGTYRFTWNITDKKVTVTYPISYTVTYYNKLRNIDGTITTATTGGSISGMSGSASGSQSSGKYFNNTETVTLTHSTANGGYNWIGWYNSEACSSAYSTGGNVTISDASRTIALSNLSANTKVAALYEEIGTTVTLANDGHGHVEISSATVSSTTVGKTTSRTIVAVNATGYHFNCWVATSGTDYTIGNTGNASTTLTGKGSGYSSQTVTATFTPNSYQVHFNGNGNTGGSMSNETGFTYDVAKTLTANSFTKTGYHFYGWATSKANADSKTRAYTDGQSVSNLTSTNNGTAELWAIWEANPYTVTLDVDEANKGNIASATTSQDVTYDGATTTVPNRPTAAQGYALYGYYTGHNGTGTKVINADGTWIASVTGYTDGSKRWVHDGDVTLYAYYKNAEITAITLNQSIFEPVAAGGSSYVTANPTIEPTPAGDTKICWALLYDDENPVTGDYKAEAYTEGGAKPNQIRFNLAGLAAGSYRIRATLYTGTTCSGDTLLSTYDKSVTIATDFQVTVKYMCGTEEIKASEIVDGHATTETTISAPDIFGYTFSTWDLGDGGITTEMALTTKDNFEFKATYNGILTANYTKKKYIYLDLSGTFSESGKWDNPYCYIYDSNTSWNNDKGTGATGTMHCIAKGAMTQITGTDIWYYDYSSYTASFANKVAFTWDNQTSQEYFYAVDVIYRADFSEGTPLFVPAVGQNKEVKNSSGKYYNRGYWTNYIGSKTGYTLRIYNKDDVLIKEILFRSTSNDMRMTMKATVDLEAATTYKVEILRDNGHYYKNNDARNYGNSQNNWEYREDLSKGSLLTTAAGDYTFTLSYTDYSNDKNYQIRMIVDYPANEGDFQVLYGDRDTWSLNSAHSATWRHPSRMITARAGGVDTISFFVPKEKDPASLLPTLYARKVNSVNASTGAITWDAINIGASASQSLSVDSSAVYNFKVTQSAAGTISSIENIGAYTGEYYIRCDAMNSKWDNYTTDDDHRMTYSSFSESSANAFGEKYSHYKAKWCKYGKNVKFVIANDYSPCISDTLVQDVPNTYNNIDEDGFLKDDGTTGETENIYSANIRFMWNRKTNKISRAYVASSTNASRLFLVLRGNTAIKGLDDSPIEDEGSGIPSVILQDDQNWIYEEVLYIKPNTRFKLYACYAQVTASPNGAQYFRGSYNGNAFSGDPGVDSENSVVLIGGGGETYQKARVLYDFKTNRLICAWLPSSSAIDEEIGINADVMVIREHHEPAQYISFKDEDSKLTGVKTVYGVMKFNRWILNNRQQTGSHEPLAVGDQKSIYERSLYFVSFPFDVRVGDIFGFGRYWDEWYIEYYDGLNRAKNGYWIDSPPNWKYVTPEMATNYVLKANEGYILGLDLDFMAYDNTTFWAHDIETIELFFPSTTSQETLQQVNCTIPALSAIEGDPYRCRINRDNGEGDRRVKDSYWRCLGVPSFNIYNTSLKDASGEAITWQPSGNTLPFIYMWNKGDNTLTAQSTSTFTFLPMHSYLVQNGGEIRWTNVSAKPVSPIVARRTNDMPETEYEWRLALMSDSNLIDQTYVRMTNLEQVTDSFDFGQDLSKEFNTARSNIYSYIGYERAAANSMTLKTETTTVIPLGLNIIAAGEYTLAMPDGTHGVGVTLVDTQTNERTNLSAGMAQTVTLAQGDYLNRFFLEISPIHNAPTGIEEVTGNGLPTTEARKVLIDGILYIVKDGHLFDATGKRVE